eukprot:scaffold1310_cov106-Isochrysis_galbana.AAC.1
MVPGRQGGLVVSWVGSCACCASVGWATNGSLESPFRGLSRGAGGGSCAGCASVGWATDSSLESSFQGLSNGARGWFCGCLVPFPRSVECGFGVTRAVGLCLDAV